MSFGAELIWIWSREFSVCRGRRVQRVDGGNNSVVVSFGTAELLLSWGAQNCGAALISQKERKSLLSSISQTPPITNALRSHLTGAELFDVEQLRRDRILKFTFRKTVGAGFTATRCIIIEIMERYSNILLTDESENIIETAKHIHPADNNYRTVLPGLPYRLPPALEGLALEEWLASPDAASITKITGFGKPLLKILSEVELERAVSILGSFYNDDNNKTTFVLQRIGRYITSLPELLPQSEPIEENNAGKLVTLAPLCDVAFEARKKRAVQIIEKEITRRERQAQDIEKLLADDKAELYRQYGELIVANLWQIRHNVAEAELTGYDGSGKERPLKVPLDPRISPSQNAALYFTKYKKITAAQERAATLLVSVREELSDHREALELARSIGDAGSLTMLEEELGIAKTATQRRGTKRREPQLPPHRRFEFEKALVFAGLSSKGNRYVTFKLALADDLWFHAQGVPGSHVILRPLTALSEEESASLKAFCASLAAYHSKFKAASRLRVDYTKRRYVSPIRGGEANVTYKEFSTISASPKYWQEFLENR